MNLTAAQSVTAGAKKTFQASATTAPIRLTGVTTDPSALSNGDIWFRSTNGNLKYRENGTTRILTTNTKGQALTNKTIAFGSNTISGLPVQTFTNGANDRIITATGTAGVNGESQLTFNTTDGLVVSNKVGVTGAITATGMISGSLISANCPTLTIAAGASTWDLRDSNFAVITLNDDITLTLSNPVIGTTYTLTVIQNSSGGPYVVTSWNGGTTVLWPGGTAPTLSTAANEVDVVSFVYDGARLMGVSQLNFS